MVNSLGFCSEGVQVALANRSVGNEPIGLHKVLVMRVHKDCPVT